jgi:hypothetical protein
MAPDERPISDWLLAVFCPVFPGLRQHLAEANAVLVRISNFTTSVVDSTVSIHLLGLPPLPAEDARAQLAAPRCSALYPLDGEPCSNPPLQHTRFCLEHAIDGYEPRVETSPWRQRHNYPCLERAAASTSLTTDFGAEVSPWSFNEDLGYLQASYNGAALGLIARRQC